MGQRESSATSAYEFAEWQTFSRPTSERELRQKDLRCRWRELGDTGEEDGCGSYVAQKRLSAFTVAAYLHPKSNGKLRPLGIPTMKDRAMQALHLLALDPIAETTADENSYGFHKRRSCADAI
jgi:hypothetical protein